MQAYNQSINDLDKELDTLKSGFEVQYVTFFVVLCVMPPHFITLSVYVYSPLLAILVHIKYSISTITTGPCSLVVIPVPF
jgi:hypothetical protein